MKAYLLDTNIVSHWFNATSAQHDIISAKAMTAAQQGAKIWTSVITLGEIEYGINTAPKPRMPIFNHLRTEIDNQFVHGRFVLGVSRHTATVYADLRARLFEAYSPEKKRKKGMRPEEMVCPTTSKDLGIQENDLWIASLAIERNAVLVTNDGIGRIRDVANELMVEDWCV